MANTVQKSSINHKISMAIISKSRKLFLNTWVHRLPITIWVYKRVFYFGKAKQEEEISFKNLRLLVHTKDVYMVPSLINDEFENFELKVFEDLIKPGMEVLDVGANIGIYSLIANRKVGSKGKVHAFEPVPENVDLIKKNIALNKATRVKLIERAVGDSSKDVSISIVEDSLSTHHIGDGSGQTLSVKSCTIDSYVKKNDVKVGLIKMDIEGYEGYAIAGANNTLAGKDMILLTEFSEEFIKRSGKDPIKCGAQLLSMFKYCYAIDEKNESLPLVNDVRTLMRRDYTNFLFTNKKKVHYINY